MASRAGGVASRAGMPSADAVATIAAAVPFYGTPKEEFVKLSKSLPPILGHYAKNDAHVSFERVQGIQKRAAELLRIKPTTLNEMIKRYDIRPRRKRNGADGEAAWP